MGEPFSLWIYLATTPLLWLTLTVVIWVLADWLAQLSGHNPLVNPVMIAIAAISAILLATGTSYGTYFTGAQFIHFLLGPTTVAIAIPLYKNWPLVRHKVLPLLAALVAGTATSIVSAIAVACGARRAARRGDFARPQIGHRRRRHEPCSTRTSAASPP